MTSATALADRLDRLPTGRFHRRLQILIGGATFADGADAMVLPLVLPSILRQWHLGLGQVGTMISIGFLGQALGAVAMGWLAQRIGRKPVIRLSILLFASFSLLSAVAQTYGQLLVARFAAGIGLGGEGPVAASYMSEFAPKATRGRFILLYQLSFIAGQAVVALLASAVVPAFGWRILPVVGALPLLLLPLIQIYCPESPRWLATRGRHEEAERIVRRLEAETGGAPEVAEETVAPLPPAAPPARGSIFDRRSRRTTIVLGLMWMTVYAVIYGLQSWLPTLLTLTFKVPARTVLLLSAGTTAAVFVANLSAALLFDRIPRRSWFFGGLCVAFAAVAAIFFDGAGSLPFLVIMLWVAMAALGPLSLALYLYTAELYVTALRSAALGTLSFLMRGAAVVAPLAIAWMVGTMAVKGAFLFAMICIACGLLALGIGRPAETRGRPLDASA